MESALFIVEIFFILHYFHSFFFLANIDAKMNTYIILLCVCRWEVGMTVQDAINIHQTQTQALLLFLLISRVCIIYHYYHLLPLLLLSRCWGE